MNDRYGIILEREFRKSEKLDPMTQVKVIFGVEAGGHESNEMIHIITYTSPGIISLYTMYVGSDDDEFVFVDQENGREVSFDFPDDWLDLAAKEEGDWIDQVGKDEP